MTGRIPADAPLPRSVDGAILALLGMAKIYDKGQVTIPKRVRDAAGLTVGDHVLIEARDGEVVIRKPSGVLEFEAPQTARDALP